MYKKVVGELWDEYYRLYKEVKEAVREKKLNEVVEKDRKEFWAFIGRRTKG